MHQRTVTSRPRQQLRREKIFRPTKEEGEKNKSEFSASTTTTNNTTTAAAVATTLSTATAPRRGGPIFSTPNTFRVNYSSPDRSRTAVIIKHRDVSNNSARSRSRDGGPRSKLITIGKTEKELSGGVVGYFNATTPRKRNEGSPAKILPSDPLRSDGQSLQDQTRSYLEEPQLSKLVSRVLRDDERDRRLSACRQLKDYLQHPENAHVVQKMGLSTVQELARVYFDRTALEVKEEVAHCAGMVAATLGRDVQSFLQWLFRKYESTSNEEGQVLLLQTLHETVKFDERKQTNNLEAYMPMIMTRIQSALEVTDSQPLLVAIVDIVLIVAQRYSDTFHSHFHDTVDILVGWHIDPLQSESIIQYTSDALIQFHQFWVNDISFSITLLGQFLEDIEAYAEEHSSLDDIQSANEDLPGKISSLIRVYSTVVRSLKDYFSPDRSPLITKSFISENFSRLLSSVLLGCSSVASEVILMAANDCVALLLSHLKDGALPHLDQLTSLIQLQMNAGHWLMDKQVISLLNLTRKVVIELNCQLPAEFLGKIIGSNSLFPSMKFWPNNEIRQHVLDLYRAIFGLKTVALLEEAYRYLLIDLHRAFKSLLNWDLEIPFVSVKRYHRNQALTSIIFDLCAIAEIGNTKNSLIAMLALNPSIFDLLISTLKPLDVELAINYPTLQYAIIFTLYSHCKMHSNFLSSSGLINASETPPADRPTTSGHFTVILDLLGKLLSNSMHNWDVRLLALNWARLLMESVQNYLEQLCLAPSFIQLLHTVITVGFNCREDVSYHTVAILNIVLHDSVPNLPKTLLVKCLELCLVKMADNNEEIRNLYAKLSSRLPLDILLSFPFWSFYEYPVVQNSPSRMCGMQTFWQMRRRLQGRSPLGTFTSQDFRTVMSFILLGTKPKKSWLKDMFAMDQRAEKLVRTEDHTFTALVTSNEGMLWFWCVYEAALFCILSKLRTPLGKPQETLAAIEVAVKKFAAETLGQAVSEGQFNEIVPLGNTDLSTGHFLPHLRGKLLLDFLEQLEKFIYNAYEGCAIALMPAPKAMKTFFRTNKATCQEWLARVRKVAMTLALQLGHPAIAVRHGYQLLWDLSEADKLTDQEFHQVAFQIVQGLLALGCPDAILGLYAWAKEEQSLKLTWMKAAVDMAAGRYENAAHEFSCILMAMSKSKDKIIDHQRGEEKLDPLGTVGHSSDNGMKIFARNQILECYRRLGDWSELAKWLESEKQKPQDMQWPTEMNLDHVRALAMFDDSEDHFKLSNMEESHSQHLWKLNPRFLCQKAEKSLLQINTGRDKVLGCCEEAFGQLSGLIRLSCMESPIHLPLELATVHHMTYKLKQWAESQGGKPMLTQLEAGQSSSEVFDMAALVQAIRWMKCSQDVAGPSGSIPDAIKKLGLVACRSARKQQNLHVAQQLMFKRHGLDTDSLFVTEINGSIARGEVEHCREGCKLLHGIGNSMHAARTLSSNVITVINYLNRDEADHATMCNSHDGTLAELNARSLLTLVKWIQMDPQLLSSVATELRDGRVASGSNGLVKDLSSFDVDGMDVEIVMGRLLWIGTKQCPWLAKAWSELAAWCYRAGKKEVDKASEVGIEMHPDEQEKLISILPKGCSDEEAAMVCHILSQIHCSSGEREKLDSNSSMANDGSDINSWRQETLMSCPVLQSLSSVSIDALLDLWSTMTNRAYTFYRVACEAYFTFLKLNGSSNRSTLRCSSPGEDGNVIATLRLLRLMVKHASELRDVLEAGLANTPTAPWKGIIPQLFARLNHPESYVRRSISDLLCRVTAAAPHLIVFPAVVGSSAVLGEIKDSSGILGECLSQQSDDGLNDRSDEASQDGEVSMALVEENQQKAAVMQNCFAAMVDTLAKQDPRSIAEVQRLVHELRRITLLWDEFWLGTMNQYHVDFGRRISQLEKEINKVKNNSSLSQFEKSSLIAKKHDTFLKPTLFVLEQLQQVTSQLPETPHEVWFQENFGTIIEDVIRKLKNPTTPEQPQISWQLYKQLLYSLQQRVQKRSSSVLNMTQISPVLASMKGTSIAMPGAQIHSDQIVTIQSIDHTVSILPTKTKPKKLVFFGSDGKKYSFLFKGLEDLHLDERIMQLLAIVNNMFDRYRRSTHAAYRARHYTVTPLGPRSGLIQWVEGATPLFGLYKRWQQREAMAPISKTAAAHVSSVRGGNQSTVMRPSDIYYSKLTPLLKEKGITNLENRKEWPLPILRQVLLELMMETPRDLLAKELWCASTSAVDWWSIIETYTHSSAVMSVIGYIIGLGDRHLDNVLVDLETGEVVHIDYNVCFEKGKNLRVPEKVPFRMTPNLKTALGFMGVEGTFRVSCEHVLKTLRRGRETLLTLLEAFVYDPLIDWTPGSEGGYTGAVYGGWQGTGTVSRPRKQDMERSLVYSMFNIRMVEMKAEWGTNRDELLEAMPKLQNLLEVWSQCHGRLQISEEEMQELHQQMAFLKEAEANPSHPLHTLHQRCADYLVVKDHIKTARAATKEKLDECDNWHKLHKNALDAVQGQELAVWRSEVAKQQISGVLTLPPVVEFLQAAGKGQLLQQCEQAEKEVAGLLSQQQALLSETLDTLATYATIISQSPVTYVEESRNYRWQQWLRELCEDFTVSKCQDIISKFHTCYGPESMDMIAVRNVVGIEYQLQQLVTEYNSMLHKLLERLHVENLDVSLSRMTPEESKACISNHVLEHGKYGAYSVACVVISALGNHSRRLGVMESAALAAGDRLADYTSRDGDWFLDEIYIVSANIDELVSLLYQSKEILSPAATNSLKAINSCHQVVTSLQELHLNFRTIILPEAMKCLQRNDTSVQEILHQLDSLVTSLGTPLPTIVQQLELQVRNVVMEMEPPESNASLLVEELKNKCKPLLEGDLDSEGLSPGQMLLMGFNGLFTKLEQDFWHFREASIPVMATMHTLWRKVDLIKEAHSHLSPSFLNEAYELLNHIFFVKRVQAVTEFFTLIQHHCWALKGASSSYPLNNSSAVPSLTLYNEDVMSRPVRSFIAEYIGKMMLGLPTQGLGLALCHSLECCGLDVSAEVNLRDIGAQNKVALEDLCRKAIEACLRNDSFQPSHFAQANTLVANWERAWRKQIVINRCTQNIMIQKSVLQRAQLQLAYHQWINEDLLMQGGGLSVSSVALPTRSTIMTEIRKKMQGLMAMESSLGLAREHYLSLGNSVEQRLRWAAGANPSVATTLEDYEHLVSSVNQLIVGLSKVSTEVSSACSSILHFEALRSHTAEAVAYDNGFLQLINRCQESCLLEQNCHSVVQPLEEKLLLLKVQLPDKHSINSEWITSVTNKIASKIGEVQKLLSEQQGELTIATDNIKSFIMTIRSYLSTHHRLMNEIRAILKSMTKYEDQLNGPNVIGMSIRQYVAAYRIYSEHITMLVKETLAEDLTAERVANFLVTVDGLKISTLYVYNTLIVLSEQLDIKDGGDGKQAAMMSESAASVLSKGDDVPLSHGKATGSHKLLAISGGVDLLSGASPVSQTVTKIPVTATPKKSRITRDPRTGKAVQERNSYAVSVWKRVKMKLDGRDPDANKRSTVPEQVDYIIKEATNLDNLATLYEGWTPWV